MKTKTKQKNEGKLSNYMHLCNKIRYYYKQIN